MHRCAKVATDDAVIDELSMKNIGARFFFTNCIMLKIRESYPLPSAIYTSTKYSRDHVEEDSKKN